MPNSEDTKHIHHGKNLREEMFLGVADTNAVFKMMDPKTDMHTPCTLLDGQAPKILEKQVRARSQRKAYANHAQPEKTTTPFGVG